MQRIIEEVQSGLFLHPDKKTLSLPSKRARSSGRDTAKT